MQVRSLSRKLFVMWYSLTRKVFFAKVYLTFNFHKRKIESENNSICRLGDLDGRNERINSWSSCGRSTRPIESPSPIWTSQENSWTDEKELNQYKSRDGQIKISNHYKCIQYKFPHHIMIHNHNTVPWAKLDIRWCVANRILEDIMYCRQIAWTVWNVRRREFSNISNTADLCVHCRQGTVTAFDRRHRKA